MVFYEWKIVISIANIWYNIIYLRKIVKFSIFYIFIVYKYYFSNYSFNKFVLQLFALNCYLHNRCGEFPMFLTVSICVFVTQPSDLWPRSLPLWLNVGQEVHEIWSSPASEPLLTSGGVTRVESLDGKWARFICENDGKEVSQRHLNGFELSIEDNTIFLRCFPFVNYESQSQLLSVTSLYSAPNLFSLYHFHNNLKHIYYYTHLLLLFIEWLISNASNCIHTICICSLFFSSLSADC